MKYVLLLLTAVMCFGLAGCQTSGVGGSGTVRGEQAVAAFNVGGLKIGDRTKSLSRFAQVQKQPFGRTDYEIYEIYNPNDQISIAIAYFQHDRLKKLEIRYFDGPGISTLSRAGGWEGLRDYICSRFGPPSRTGAGVALATDYYGLKPEGAKFNGEWVFSRKNRKVNYVAFSDAKGGLGIVTVSDVTPIVVPKPRPTPTPVLIPKVKTVPVPAPGALTSTVAKPLPTPPPGPRLIIRPAPANPGF